MAKRTREPARIFTNWGTSLFVGSDGALHHGPPDTSPDNLRLAFKEAAAGGTTHLEEIKSGPGTRITVDPASLAIRVASSHDAEEALVERVPIRRGLFGLTVNGRYLCCELDGRVTASREICSAWEALLADQSWCGAAIGRCAEDKHVDQRAVGRISIAPFVRHSIGGCIETKKIVAFGYTKWSHGRVYHDLSNELFKHNIIFDVLDWEGYHAKYVHAVCSSYDHIVTSPDGVRILVDVYGFSPERLIVVSHSEYDLKILIQEKGADFFERFAAYAAVSHVVYAASINLGIKRIPSIAPLGIAFDEFHQLPAPELSAVGYASSMKLESSGVDIKRGHLAEQAAAAAELDLKIAGSTANQLSFHDMPSFYSGVGAILMTSVNEAGPLPVLEAAAAGRLVIGTPVGHFPLLAYVGGGLIAPIEATKFVEFAADKLSFYKREKAAYLDVCYAAQAAARQFDWSTRIDAWQNLLETDG